jgi:hypothetical protein
MNEGTEGSEKPKVKLVGEDGNVFNIIGRVLRALNQAGLSDKAQEFQRRALAAHSYDEVLQLAMEYTEVE